MGLLMGQALPERAQKGVCSQPGVTGQLSLRKQWRVAMTDLLSLPWITLDITQLSVGQKGFS
jgi:hypothetical protein